MTEWAWTVLTSAAGTTALLGILGYLCKGIIDERLKNAIKSEYDIKIEETRTNLKRELDREMETLKSQFQRHFLVYKAQFDVEFDAYRRIWAALADLLEKTARVVKLYSLTEKPEGKGYKKELAVEADTAFFTAYKQVIESEPFIPADIYESIKDLTSEVKAEIDGFFGAIKDEENGNPSYDQEKAGKESRTKLKTILESRDMIAASIRTRIETLKVIS